MKQVELTCICCPMGCNLRVELDGESILSVAGNGCKRGEEYARQECVAPVRVITASVPVVDGKLARVSVKTAVPVPKNRIFDVMDDLIDTAKIDAKHSNEDVIAPFDRWVTDYGSRIGNFGGIDTDAVCRLDRAALKEYILEVISKCKGHGGFAFGSGNSIPTYVPLENYINMLEIVREYRGE